MILCKLYSKYIIASLVLAILCNVQLIIADNKRKQMGKERYLCVLFHTTRCVQSQYVYLPADGTDENLLVLKI